MNLLTGISLLAVMITLATIPSASVALVITRSATLGFVNGVAVIFGIVLGDLLFVSLAILGMNFLAESIGPIFILLKYIGGAYLIWFGFSLLRKNKDVGLKGVDSSRFSICASFFAGFILTIGDIKAILFYASLFPNFVEMSRLTTIDITVIFLVTIIAVGGVKLFYALVANRIVNSLQNSKNQELARSTAGCVMLGAGTYIISKT